MVSVGISITESSKTSGSAAGVILGGVSETGLGGVAKVSCSTGGAGSGGSGSSGCVKAVWGTISATGAEFGVGERGALLVDNGSVVVGV